MGCEIDGDDTSGIAAAVEAARRADVAVVVVGGKSGLMPDCTSGEFRDATDLGLTGVQQQLVEAVVATGTPTVVVLVNGRIFALPWIAEYVAGGRRGVAARRGGRQRDRRRAVRRDQPGRPAAGLDAARGRPGAGLLQPQVGRRPQPDARRLHRLSPPRRCSRSATASATRASTMRTSRSRRRGRPPTDAAARRRRRDQQRRARRRRGRAALRPRRRRQRHAAGEAARRLRAPATCSRGETRRVRFTLDPSQLAFFDADMRFVVEPGAFRVMIGASSEDIRIETTIDHRRRPPRAAQRRAGRDTGRDRPSSGVRELVHLLECASITRFGTVARLDLTPPTVPPQSGCSSHIN